MRAASQRQRRPSGCLEMGDSSVMPAESTRPGFDLGICDQDPIRVPGSIQPSGVLLALAGDPARIVCASSNLREHLGRDAAELIGQPLSAALGEDYAARLSGDLYGLRPSETPVYLRTVSAPREDSPCCAYHVLVHANPDGKQVLELECADAQESILFKDLYPLVTTFVTQLQGMRSEHELASLAAEEVRRITGFDRVMVYRFDKGWNGTVIAEDRNDELPSYMDHRFPASDMPAQARELYRLNRVRLIVDCNDQPVPLVTANNHNGSGPLDLTFSVLRSVSPVHLEYMRNMGTAAAMSVSILRKGELWGLISCHHHAPKRVPYDVRVACDFLTQVLSLQLEAAEYSSEYTERIRLKNIEGRLLAQMTRNDSFVEALVEAGDDLLNFEEASGAAVVSRDDCRLLGRTPTLSQVREICDWFAEQGDGDSIHTDRLGEVFPRAKEFEDVASGVLAVRISKLHRSYLLWFRPEVVRIVKWRGEPQTITSDGDNSRLHPRGPFETWKETVRGTSLPWRRAQIEAALDLRNVVVGLVLRKAEELAEVNSELQRANNELEAFSYSVSHDLRAPFRHIVGYAELLREHESDRLSDRGKRYAETIIESAQYAGKLVDDLLNFARISRTSINLVSVDMNQLAHEVIRELSEASRQPVISWECADMPQVTGDPMMLRLVWRNLLTNAVKYTRDREQPRISIGCEAGAEEIVFWVQDNGVGFDMRYVDKLFGVFQRLHRMEEFEGTGIGLANVRRIISRHKGRTWAKGEVGKGATFYFTLPTSSETEVS